MSPEEGRGELIGSVSILTPPLGIGRTAQSLQPTQPSLPEEYIATHNWQIPESQNIPRRNQRIFFNRDEWRRFCENSRSREHFRIRREDRRNRRGRVDLWMTSRSSDRFRRYSCDKNGQLERRTEYGTGGMHEVKYRRSQSYEQFPDRSRDSRHCRDSRDGRASKVGDRNSEKSREDTGSPLKFLEHHPRRVVLMVRRNVNLHP